MRIFIALIALLIAASCEASVAKKEAEKTLKQQSASDRINSTKQSSDSLFKELDE